MAATISIRLPSGTKMPALGLGTWEISDEAEIEKTLNTALEEGYRHIDTAYIYRNEAVIGKVLQEWITANKLKRKDLFITTKLPLMAMHPDRVELFMRKSLENLQLNYVDLYLIHCPIGLPYEEGVAKLSVNEKGEMILGGKTDHVGIWKKMEEQVDAGRARNIGLSNYNISQIQTILDAARIKPANLQVELHVYLQQKELVEFCRKKDITIVAYSPLGCPGYNKMLKRIGKEERELLKILEDPVVLKIAKKHKKSAAQVALRFLIQNDLVAIPKSVTPERIKENIDVFDFKLDDGDMEELYKLDMGEEGRVSDFRAFAGITEHPDYPFKK